MTIRTHTFSRLCSLFTAASALFLATALSSLPVQAQITPAPHLGLDDQIDSVVLANERTDQVLSFLEMLTGRIILRPQNLPDMNFNFDSKGRLTRAETIKAIESILSMNGLAVVEQDERFLRAVPTGAMANTLTPEFITEDTFPADFNSQKIYARLFTLQYLRPEKALEIIARFVTPNLPVPVLFEQSSKILITDSLNNLRRIEAVFKTADRPAERQETLNFIALKNTQAREIGTRLNALINGSLQSFLVGSTLVEADERTNQIILLTHPANLKLVETMIERLDINVSALTTTKVFRANHAKAPELATLLSSIISGQREARQRANNSSNNNDPADRAAALRRRASQETPEDGATADNTPIVTNLTDGGSDGTRNVQFSEHIGVVADERTNSIIVYGTRSDIEQIELLLDQIDILLPQVLIEVIIAEVTLNDNQTRGIDALGIDISRIDTVWGLSNINFNIDGVSVDKGNVTESANGATLSNFDFNLLIGPDSGRSNVKVLNAPQILTTHAREGKINVGQRRPVVTSSQADSTGTSTRSQVQLRDIGIELTVTPLIGADGKIQLEIFQKVENVVGNVSIDGNQQPIIGNREATSFVSVRDRETIILGGLQEYNVSQTESRMSILGRIPILGNALFTRKSDTSDRTELMIFIRPHILNDTAAASIMTNERRQRSPMIDEGVKQLIERGLQDPEPEPERESTFFNPRVRR